MFFKSLRSERVCVRTLSRLLSQNVGFVDHGRVPLVAKDINPIYLYTFFIFCILHMMQFMCLGGLLSCGNTRLTICFYRLLLPFTLDLALTLDSFFSRGLSNSDRVPCFVTGLRG